MPGTLQTEAASQPSCCSHSNHSHPAYRYDTVAKLGISSSKQHLQTAFPDGIPLETAFVSPSVIHQLDASAEDAVQCGSWCDVQALLPPALSHEDAAGLLEHCSVMQSSGKLAYHSTVHARLHFLQHPVGFLFLQAI